MRVKIHQYLPTPLIVGRLMSLGVVFSGWHRETRYGFEETTYGIFTRVGFPDDLLIRSVDTSADSESRRITWRVKRGDIEMMISGIFVHRGDAYNDQTEIQPIAMAWVWEDMDVIKMALS